MTEGRSQRPIWLGEDRRRWDHVRLHIQLLQDSRLDAYDIAVYAGIAAHAETGTGLAHPSEATLAGYAGCSERKARASARKMADLGYIAVTPRLGKASIYSLLPPPELSTPRQVVPGSTADLGTSWQRPRNVTPRTSEPRSDELEVNEKPNQRRAARSWGQPDHPPFAPLPPRPPTDDAGRAALAALRRRP